MKKLDDKTKSLVAVGAAIAVDCIPCFKWHSKNCLDNGLSLSELNEAIELAKIIKVMPTKLFNKSFQRTLQQYKNNYNDNK